MTTRKYGLLVYLGLALVGLARGQDDRATGLSAFDRRDFEAAYHHLSAAYSADSSDAEVGAKFYKAALQLMARHLKADDYPKVEEVGQWAAGIDISHVPVKAGHLVAYYRGVAHMRQEAWDEAIGVMESTRGQFPHPVLTRALAESYFSKKDWPRAIEALREFQSSSGGPMDRDFYGMLTRSLRDSGDVAGAVSTLDEGLASFPEDADLAAIRARLGTEHAVESTMTSGATWHFALKFQDVQEQDGIRRRLMDLLEEVYTEVTGRFSYYPEQPTQVVLYSSRTSFEGGVLGVASWMGACYDGKLRIPIEDVQETDDRLRGTLRHEFTHAIVSMLAKDREVPAWLNEGLAQILEGKEEQESLASFRYWTEAARGAGQPATIPLSHLSSPSFGHLTDEGTVERAYLQSLLFTRFLEQKFGFWKLQQLVQNLGEGYALDAAIRGTLGGDLASHEQKWIEAQTGGLVP